MMYSTKEHNTGSRFAPESFEGSSPSREGDERIGQTGPEVLPKKKRRYYTTKYKLRILDQVDQLTEQGQVGAFLRRESLYYSTISRWRKQRDQGAFQGLSKKRGPKESKNKQEEKIMLKYRSIVNADLGNPDGAIVFDETSFPKKGNDSVGVARQYCGSTGKVDNCQVGVFAAYVSEFGYSLVDKSLFIPEKWFDEEYRVRREKCKLPENISFKTKPQLAVDMLNNLAAEQTLPFKYVLGDSIYGNSSEFINAASSLPGVTYFVSVPENIQCWPKTPTTIKKQYKYKGKLRTKTVLVDKNQKPVKLSTLAKSTNSYFWYRRIVSEP